MQKNNIYNNYLEYIRRNWLFLLLACIFVSCIINTSYFLFNKYYKSFEEIYSNIPSKYKENDKTLIKYFLKEFFFYMMSFLTCFGGITFLSIGRYSINQSGIVVGTRYITLISVLYAIDVNIKLLFPEVSQIKEYTELISIMNNMLVLFLVPHIYLPKYDLIAKLIILKYRFIRFLFSLFEIIIISISTLFYLFVYVLIHYYKISDESINRIDAIYSIIAYGFLCLSISLLMAKNEMYLLSLLAGVIFMMILCEELIRDRDFYFFIFKLLRWLTHYSLFVLYMVLIYENRERNVKIEHQKLIDANTEINHRVRTNLMMIISRIKNAKKAYRLTEQEVFDDFTVIELMTHSLLEVHNQLQNKKEMLISLSNYIKELLDELKNTIPALHCENRITDNIYVGTPNGSNMGIVVSELLFNAYKHSPSELESKKISILFDLRFEDKIKTFFIIVKNQKSIEKKPNSSNREAHGSDIIRRIVKKYNGKLVCEDLQTEYKVVCVIPISSLT